LVAFFKGKVVVRHPIWILNSSLAMLLFIAAAIVLLTQQKVPRFVSIEPTAYSAPMAKQISTIDINKIYDNDLFDTYQKKDVEIKKKQLADLLPPPPVPLSVTLPGVAQPNFLEPLQIKLKGIIFVGDDQKNRALIERTGQEFNFKLGDTIEDAQLIGIFKNKVVIIRSNGQEETIFLREKEAKKFGIAHSLERWEDVIKIVDANHFVVDPEAFIEVIPSLAALINDLDLITVYKNGQPAGTRIGSLNPGSLGLELGLQMGDIITAINGKKANTVTERLGVYADMIRLPLGAVIEVGFTRFNSPQKIVITLEDFGKKPTLEFYTEPRTTVQEPKKTVADIEEEKAELLRKNYNFAPTLQEIKRREKKMILEKIKHKEQGQKTLQKPVRFDI
jgi:type II secretion system protein C